MGKLLLSSVAALALLAVPVSASAGGLKTGQNDATLAATKCGNNGKGNQGETFNELGECLKGSQREETTLCVTNPLTGERVCIFEDLDPGNSGPATDD